MKKLKIKPEAFIFDMDGVIVDSMPYHFIAWYESLRPIGVRVSCLDVYTNEGEQWEKTLRKFLLREKIKPTPQLLKKIFRIRQESFKKNFKRYVFEGIENLLLCLKNRKYRLGLVTGTTRDGIKEILPTKIKCLFDCIVSSESTNHGKPHPEPYLKASKLLNVKPSKCVVIENAPFGIESAKKSGMICIALTTTLTPEYLKKADIIVNNIDELKKIIDLCGV
jgi:beta-phosphoglucomutase